MLSIFQTFNLHVFMYVCMYVCMYAIQLLHIHEALLLKSKRTALHEE